MQWRGYILRVHIQMQYEFMVKRSGKTLISLVADLVDLLSMKVVLVLVP